MITTFHVWRVGRLAFARKGIKRNLGWRRLFWRAFWIDAKFWNCTDTAYTSEKLRQFIHEGWDTSSKN